MTSVTCFLPSESKSCFSVKILNLARFICLFNCVADESRLQDRFRLSALQLVSYTCSCYAYMLMPLNAQCVSPGYIQVTGMEIMVPLRLVFSLTLKTSLVGSYAGPVLTCVAN